MDKIFIVKFLCMQNKKACSVGIDVSKMSNEVAVIFDDNSHLIKSFANNQEGLSDLIIWLNQQDVTRSTPCVIESTGDFHLLSAVKLTNNNFTVKLINPIITKQYQRATVRDAKTDKIDALRLARIGISETGLKPFSASLNVIGAKKLLSEIALLENMKQQYRSNTNRLKETKKILDLPVDCQGSDKVLKALEKQIANLYKQVQKLMPEPAKKLARETPGLSERQMAVIAATFSGKQFTDRDQVVAFVGLDIRKRQSGAWQGKEHISKRGNAFVRKILFQIGWSLKQHNKVYAEYYQRLHTEGKHYFTCLLAVARKFLRFLFSCYLNPNLNLDQSLSMA